MTPPPVASTADVSASAPVQRPSDPNVDDSPAALAARMRLAVARLNRRARQEVLTAGDDITVSKLGALAIVEKHGPITLGDLAAEEQVQPPSMTRIVAGLEQQGLVTRQVDPADRRVFYVEVTDAGRELLARTRTRRNAFLAQRVARFTDDERATLAAALPLLERILEDD